MVDEIHYHTVGPCMFPCGYLEDEGVAVLYNKLPENIKDNAGVVCVRKYTCT